MSNTSVFLIAALLAPASSWAQVSAAESLSMVKSNIEISEQNKADFAKSGQVIDQNLKNLQTAKKQAQDQENELKNQVSEGQAALGKVQSSESQIQKWIAEEKSNIAAENQLIQNLQKQIADLQKNQTERQANLEAYQSQLNQLSEAKSAVSRELDSRKELYAKAKAQSQQVNNLDSTWKKKQKANEAELSRWQSEIAKQKKTLESLESLASKGGGRS